MRLSIGTNFDDRLPEILKDTNVEVFYGKLSSDIIGGGRPTFALPKIDKHRVEEHISTVHRYGFKFNYLLNATCLDNLETTKEFNRQLEEMLEWLGCMKVDYITLTVPMLIERVKSVLPDVKISLSTFANVNSISQVRYFEELGVDEITLPESKNRDFRFLEQLRKSTKCGFQLIATNDCMFECPLRHHHANFQSHASQSQHITDGFALDYCMLRCTHWKLKHPEELVKSPWIRPEDLKIYEDLGFDKVKLTERMKKTEKIAETAMAYLKGSYDGNLLRLLNSRLSEEDFEIPDFAKNMKSEFVQPEKMSKVYRLIFSLKAEIDNKELNGFIEGFRLKNCSMTCCDTCGYCHAWATKVVKMDVGTDRKVEEFERLFNELGTGEFFDMNSRGAIVWNDESQMILSKFIELKPEFIRITAEKEIKNKAEEIAMGRGAYEVLPEDVAKANIACTPEEFRVFALSDLKALGFDPGSMEVIKP